MGEKGVTLTSPEITRSRDEGTMHRSGAFVGTEWVHSYGRDLRARESDTFFSHQKIDAERFLRHEQFLNLHTDYSPIHDPFWLCEQLCFAWETPLEFRFRSYPTWRCAPVDVFGAEGGRNGRQ